MNEMYEILFFYFFIPRGVSIRWKCYFCFIFLFLLAFIRVDGTFIVITL